MISRFLSHSQLFLFFIYNDGHIGVPGGIGIEVGKAESLLLREIRFCLGWGDRGGLGTGQELRFLGESVELGWQGKGGVGEAGPRGR